MKQTCRFCCARDCGKVLEGLAPDINKLIETHQVPASGVDVAYNQLEEISQVGVRINDDFDMLMVMRGMKSLSKDSGAPISNQGTGSSQGPAPVAPQGVTSVSE